MKNSIKNYTLPFIAFSVSVVIIIFIIKFLLLFIKNIPFLNGGLSNITQAAVLFCTGITLVIYTYETKKLRESSNEQIRVTQYQTEVHLRPYVIVEIGNFGQGSISDIYRVYSPEGEFTPPSSPKNFTDHPYDYYFRIRNVGNGTAINIRVIDSKDKTLTDYIEYFPTIIPVLCPGEKRNLYHEPYQSIDPLKSTFACTVRVNFENVEGGKYSIEERIVGGQLEITDSKRL